MWQRRRWGCCKKGREEERRVERRGEEEVLKCWEEVRFEEDGARVAVWWLMWRWEGVIVAVRGVWIEREVSLEVKGGT
jgi:hypothetical protein